MLPDDFSRVTVLYVTIQILSDITIHSWKSKLLTIFEKQLLQSFTIIFMYISQYHLLLQYLPVPLAHFLQES